MFEDLQVLSAINLEEKTNKVKEISSDTYEDLEEEQYPSLKAIIRYLTQTYQPNIEEQLGDIEAALSAIVDGNI